MSAETCEREGCDAFPEFPDDDGYLFCRGCYPEPNGGTFGHVPEPRRTELQENYRA